MTSPLVRRICFSREEIIDEISNIFDIEIRNKVKLNMIYKNRYLKTICIRMKRMNRTKIYDKLLAIELSLNNIEEDDEDDSDVFFLKKLFKIPKYVTAYKCDSDNLIKLDDNESNKCYNELMKDFNYDIEGIGNFYYLKIFYENHEINDYLGFQLLIDKSKIFVVVPYFKNPK